MAFIFGHLVGAWVVGLILQKIMNKKFSKYEWTILFLGGILPDIDYLFQAILNIPFHRTLTHSLLFALLSFIFAKLFLKQRYYLFPVGILVHLFLDLFSGPGIMLFWPYNDWVYIYQTTQSIYIFREISLAFIDMFLGFFWFVYLYVKGNLSFINS